MLDKRKEALDSIRKMCLEPIGQILRICSTKDSDAEKLLYIKLYCSKIILVIQETIEKESNK